MTSKARWMYLKLRYVEIPKIRLKAQVLRVKRLLKGQKQTAEILNLNKSFSA